MRGNSNRSPGNRCNPPSGIEQAGTSPGPPGCIARLVQAASRPGSPPYSVSAPDPLVAEHGGRIVKTTGDGALIEFPSVVGAVQCAVALQKLMAERNAGAPSERRMEWRIGIHLGDILIDGEDILGDGVNLAARLEGIVSHSRAMSRSIAVIE